MSADLAAAGVAVGGHGEDVAMKHAAAGTEPIPQK